MTTAIWWIRRDLRLHDNQALSQAIGEGRRVAPVFVMDDRLLDSPNAGPRRTAFMIDGLTRLDHDLRQRGSRLIVRRGLPEEELPRLVQELGAEEVVAQRDCSLFAKQRDAAVGRRVPLKLVEGVAALPLGSIRKEDGGAYTVFTPYSRRWKELWRLSTPALIPAPSRLDSFPEEVTGGGIDMPLLPTADGSVATFGAGEAAALSALLAFVTGSRAIYAYSERRNRPDLQGTARLSPYLRFGMLSPRQAVTAAFEAMDSAPDSAAQSSAETWLNELIWREFYISIMHEYPHVSRSSFRPEYDAIRWSNDESDFDAWKSGRTGYPFVDAAMRQLAETGWMHNRARMVVASFLVKDLLVDWRWGERWFMQQLVDGDPASNNGGWQWTAGTGTDAAPYFRVFNPVSQGAKFDPDGAFVREWIPELRLVPNTYIHEPWKMPEQAQRAFGCRIGQDYPGPIVDHTWARERVLDAYQAAR